MKKRMRRGIAVIMSAMISVITLAGCASSPDTSESALANDLQYTKPYLLTLHPAEEMNVVWLNKDTGTGIVEYGETEALGKTIRAVEYEIKGMKISARPDTYYPEDRSAYPEALYPYMADPAQNPDLKVFQQIATLKGLKSDTVYYYRTTTEIGGKKQISKIYNFKTAPLDGKDFTFALISDLQLKMESPATVKQIGQQKPDFIIYGGDIANVPWMAAEWFPVEGSYINEAERGKTSFEILQQEEDGAELLQYTPIFPVPGNHEVDDQRIFFDKATVTSGKPWSLSIYMQLFRPLYPDQEYGPGGTHWYSVDYGDLHIAAISAFRYQAWDGFEAPGWFVFDDLSADGKQVTWLKEDLEKSNAPYKWVNMHWHMLNRGHDVHFPYSTPVITGNTASYPEGDWTWNVLRPLFENTGVNGVCFGHSHVYERYLINGVNYIEAASIGNNYRAEDDPLHPSGIVPVVEQNQTRSFMILTKDSTGLSAKGYIASGPETGTVFDNFYLTRAQD